MKRLQFNFNNEVDTFEILKDEETGIITVPGPDGPLATYNSLQQLAELYAQARDVKNENLKNWTLVENGDVVSFVLRAGTAGIAAADIQEVLTEILDALRSNGTFHPLVVTRVQQELLNSDDVVTTLAMSSDVDCARAIYDYLVERNALVEPEVEVEPEPEVDPRSDVERFLDHVMECDNTLGGIARLLNLEVRATKESILDELSRSVYSASMLKALYEETISRFLSGRQNYGVATRAEALMVITQSVAQEPDADEKAKIIQTARMAKRHTLPLLVYEIGRQHIRKTIRTVTLEDVSNASIYLFGNQPTQIIFDASLDDEIAAEIERAQQEVGETEETEETDDLFWEDDEDRFAPPGMHFFVPL